MQARPGGGVVWATVDTVAAVQRRSRLVISSGRSGQLTGHMCSHKSYHNMAITCMHTAMSSTVDGLPNIP